jgi:hypothetical protein
MLYDPGYGVGEGYYCEDEGWFWANTHPTDACGPGAIQPTLWQPLPEPPKDPTR